MNSDNVGLKVGDSIFGYRICKVAELENIHGFFFELIHSASGARHIHISCPDTENTFIIVFKTVPEDSSGIAHILEHTILCGSNKYPVHDLFFSIRRRSLSTYMNAFTGPDWSMYLFSTQNKKDYYNLMDIFLDSVFFPNLSELSFKQEGCRLEIKKLKATDNDFNLVYTGVVYNEMKGAMSSPDYVMNRSLQKTLFPLRTYQYNSGGDPSIIPILTHEQLKEFHKRYYHPSNAFFYTYGSFPLKGHLDNIQEKVLQKFNHINPGIEMKSQPRWYKPKNVKCFYPLSKSENPLKKYQAGIAWLTEDIKKSFEVLALTILSQILIGNTSSPLRKALINSGLGTGLCDTSGFFADRRDTFFSCGLKDVEESSTKEIEKIIFDVLTRKASEGIEPEMVQSAVHQFEFNRKEITNTPWPYGISFFFIFANSWFHGADPLKILKFETEIERLLSKISNENYLIYLIEKYLLNNPHRVLFTLAPDQHVMEKEAERVTVELKEIKAKLVPSAIEKIRNDTEAIKKLRETKEDVSCLPAVSLEDISPSINSLNPSKLFAQGSIICYDQPTSGIFYFTGALDAGSVKKNLIPLIPFFCYALPKTGTTKHNFADMALQIALYTGGIALNAKARTRFNTSGECIPLISFNGKSLVRNQNRMIKIITELIEKVDFNNLGRLKQILLDYRDNIESLVIKNGHRLAISLAARPFSIANSLGETWEGIHQLRLIKQLTSKLTNDTLQTIANDLKSIKKELFVKDNFLTAIIGDSLSIKNIIPMLISIQNKLEERQSVGFNPLSVHTESYVQHEGWCTLSAVSFVAQVFKTVRIGHEDAPALAVISRLLQSIYLYREIRKKRGAYGVYAIYNPEDGLFSFGSYRDPNIVTTLNIYNKASEFLLSGHFDNENIKEAILQICSEIDRPDSPADSAKKAFHRQIISLTDEARLQYKQALLKIDRHKILQAAEKYFRQNESDKAIAVISSESILKAANEKLEDKPLILKII